MTSLWVAARRAVETERPDGLFRDPFARELAGDEGFAVLESARRVTPIDVPTIEVRTVFFDERLLAAGARQVAILAAGMDARAYRLGWPPGTRVYELDQPDVLAYKADKLAVAKPACERIAIPIDLRDDWPAALTARGFDPRAKTVWLVEGLLPYLHDEHVAALLARIDALSAPGSVVLCDLSNQALLESPLTKAIVEFVASLGAPWHFGCDDPSTLFGPLGWTVETLDSADYGRRLDRWPYPPVPRDYPGVPRGYLVEATKR